jgi:hypothetical protein
MKLLILRKYDKEGTCGKVFVNGEYFLYPGAYTIKLFTDTIFPAGT